MYSSHEINEQVMQKFRGRVFLTMRTASANVPGQKCGWVSGDSKEADMAGVEWTEQESCRIWSGVD